MKEKDEGGRKEGKKEGLKVMMKRKARKRKSFSRERKRGRMQEGVNKQTRQKTDGN